ncbi:MAG: cytochrome c oxidase subunit 3, partial [Candidatus Devosia euplotis]|nr:cytochrome c oxidase subunit 3 [Candidatus Devosia euplotis]
ETRLGRVNRLGPMLLLTTVLGLLFVYIQYMVGAELHGQGLDVERGAYAAVMYGLSGIHAAHVALGIIALAVLTIFAFRGAYTPPRHLRVRLWSVYWHFVGVVWLLMYVLIFVV